MVMAPKITKNEMLKTYPSNPTDVDCGPEFVCERGAAVIKVAGQGASVLELADRLGSRPRHSSDCADAYSSNLMIVIRSR